MLNSRFVFLSLAITWLFLSTITQSLENNNEKTTFPHHFLLAATVPDVSNFTICSTSNSGDPLVMQSAVFLGTPAIAVPFSINLNGIVSTHQDLKQVLVTTSQASNVLNIQYVPKTDVLDPNDAFNFSYSVNLPSWVPKGSYIVRFLVQNVNQENIGCVEVTFSI